MASANSSAYHRDPLTGSSSEDDESPQRRPPLPSRSSVPLEAVAASASRPSTPPPPPPSNSAVTSSSKEAPAKQPERESLVGPVGSGSPGSSSTTHVGIHSPVSPLGATQGPHSPNYVPTDGVQTVKSKDEANALLKHLKKLEHENSQFSASMAHVCDENARLTDRIATLQQQLAQLVQQPLAGTSVLQKLFDKDQHSSWLSGGKSATKEKLQHTLDDLQNEFIAYRQTHMTTNDEAQALVQELQNAHTHSASLTRTLNDIQKQLQRGTGTVRVLIEPDDVDATRQRAAELEHRVSELELELAGQEASAREVAQQHLNNLQQLNGLYQAAQDEIGKWKQECSNAKSAADRDRDQWAKQKNAMQLELNKLRVEFDDSMRGTSSVTDTLKAQLDRQRQECAELQQANTQLEEQFTTLSNNMSVREEMQKQVLRDAKRQHDDLTTSLNNKIAPLEASLAQRDKEKIELLRRVDELTASSNDRIATISKEFEDRLKTQAAQYEAKLQDVQRVHESDVKGLQSRLVTAQEAIAEYEAQLERSVSLQNFLSIETRYKTLQDELSLLREQQEKDHHEKVEVVSPVKSSYAEENAELLRRVDELTASSNDRIATISKEFEDRLKTQAAQYEAKLQDVQRVHESDVKGLQSRLVTAQEAIAEYEAQLERSVSLQNFLSIETRYKTLQDELSLLREQQEKDHHEKVEVVSPVKSLQHPVDESTAAALKNAKEQVSDLQEQLNALKSSEQSLRNQLAESYKQREELQRQLTVATTASTPVPSDVEQQQQTKQRQDLLVKRCAAVTQEKNALEARLKTLEDELKLKNLSLAEVQVQLQSALHAAEASNSAEKTLSEQALALAVVQEQLRAAQDALQQAESDKSAALSRHDAEKRQLLEELVRAKETIAQMDMINTKSQISLEELGQANAELERLNDEVVSLQRENMTLKAEVASEKERLKATSQLVQASNKELEDLRRSKEMWTVESSKADDALREQTHLLQNELLIHKQSVQELEERNELLTSRVAELEGERDSMQQDFAAEVSKLMEAAAADRTALEKKHADEIAAAIAAAASASAAAQAATSRRTSQDAANRSATAAKEEIGAAKAELATLQSKYEEVLNTKVKNENISAKKITQLEAQLASTSKVSDETMKERIRAYETELDQCRKHIASLREELERHNGAGQGAVSADDDPLPPGTDPMTEVKRLRNAIKQDFTSNVKYYNVKCENDKLLEEIKRQTNKHKGAEQELKSQIIELQQKLRGSSASGKSPTAMPVIVIPRSPSAASPQLRSPAGGSGTAEMESDNTAVMQALRAANENLVLEKETMQAKLGIAEKELARLRGAALTNPSASVSGAMYAADDSGRQLAEAKAKIQELTAQVVELKKLLDDRTRVNTEAARHFDATLQEVAELQSHVQALENERAKVKTDDGHVTTQAASGSVTEAPDSIAATVAKKKKVVGTKKRSTSLLGGAPSAGGDDILLAAPAAEVGEEASGDDQHRRILQKLRDQLDVANTELQKRTKEATTKQNEIDLLKEKLQSTLNELRAAHKDVEDLATEHEEEMAALQGELSRLQQQDATNRGASAAVKPVGAVAVPTVSSTVASNDAMAEARRLQLRIEELEDDNNELRRDMAALERKVQSAEAAARVAKESYESLLATKALGSTPAPVAAPKPPQQTESFAPGSNSRTPSPVPAGDESTLQKRVAYLEEQLRKRDSADIDLMRDTHQAAVEMDKRLQAKGKQVDRLAQELLPLKQKLAEYSAFVDRLGVPYPFPDELVGMQLVRLKAVANSSGTPSTPAAATRSVQARAADPMPDPSPVPPPKGRDKTSRRRELPA